MASGDSVPGDAIRDRVRYRDNSCQSSEVLVIRRKSGDFRYFRLRVTANAAGVYYETTRRPHHSESRMPSRCRVLRCEPLERREMLASISGLSFRDLNQNGSRGAIEPVLP